MTLAQASYLIGGVLIAVNAPALMVPATFRKGIEAFPRNSWMGWGLTAVALTWVAWVILHAPLGRFEPLKPYVYLAAPISFILIVLFLDELLAPRALGGLLLLLGNPVLNVARWHESGLRLVVTTLVYVWVVGGMILVLSPYRFRQAGSFCCKTNERCRVIGTVGLLVGATLVFLSLKVY